MTVGSLVAAINVRVIAEGAGVVCAAAEAVSATALSSSIPVILNRMIASQFNGYLDHRTRSQHVWERQAQAFEVVSFSSSHLAAEYGVFRQVRADLMFGEILEVARNRDGDYIKTADGNEVPDHEHIARSRLRVDTLKWCAARLAPKKYGDRVSHDVKGAGINLQPRILISWP